MKPLTCLIIDDEPLAAEVIETLLRDIPFLQLVAKFNDPLEALLYLQQHSVDILFSDIQMPKVNGVELIRSLPEPPQIIFITAHRDFAVDGFDHGITDYLLKPVRFDRLLKAVTKAKSQLEQKRQLSHPEIEHPWLFIRSEGRLIKVVCNEIHYVEAQGDYLKIVLAHESYRTQMTLTSMQNMLAGSFFFKVQRSFIINLREIRSITGNQVALSSGVKISVSPHKKDELFRLLGI